MTNYLYAETENGMLTLESYYDYTPAYAYNYHSNHEERLANPFKIGDVFVPRDNSWCINLDTFESACIAKQYHFDCEDDAEFTIVEPCYFDHVCINNKYYCVRFVNVKSSKTGNIYRAIYR